MKIAYIAAGAGNMYCGSCIRDNALARTLQKQGHDALLLPIYTPLRTDEESVASQRIFYGAINIYLQQKMSIFRHLPRWAGRWLDSPKLLRRIGVSSGATDARLLGDLTLSMLRGEQGHQKAALEQLAQFLRESFQPEVVQLTNSMLVGFARWIKHELPGVKVVTALQGEDIFLEDLAEPYKTQALEVLRERSADSDLFVAPSEFYADAMSETLGIPREKIRLARLGISVDGLESAVGNQGPPWTIGYLGRICPEKGLHLLVEAFRILNDRHGKGWARLRVAGYLGGRDREYFADLERSVREHGLADAVDWLGEVDRAQKIELLRSLDVFSMPTVYQEAKGLSILEAMACGVPVVQPEHGSFPEMVERTGGGILVPADDPEALADGLERMLEDPQSRRAFAEAGRAGVRSHYSLERMAADTLDIYREALAENGGA